jgi:hypothetical protein
MRTYLTNIALLGLWVSWLCGALALFGLIADRLEHHK